MKIVALDIGGTAIKSGFWDGSKLTDVREWPTEAKKGGPHLMERVTEIIGNYSGYDAIGISTAGQVDTTKGSIYYANENIPNYTGMPIREMLSEKFHVPVAVENDVNAAALGEMFYGAAKGCKDFLCLTYGTGVGGAIVMDGSIYTGSTFSGGSFGGIVTHPEDVIPGKEFSGCYENYASTTGLVRMAMEVDPSLTNGRAIFAAKEDPAVASVIDQWMDEIVYGIVTLVHIFNPTMIVFGGGVMAQDAVRIEVERRVKERVSPGFSNFTIEAAKLKNTAGLMGAIYLSQKLDAE